jgi:hypothetical protein
MRGMVGVVTSVKGYGKSFKDRFDRSEASLSRSTVGTKWSILRGSFSVGSNKLNSGGAASEYPLSVVPTTSKNVDISIKDIGQGTTAALWVTDSGNWWGLGIDQETNTSCNCETCTNTNYNSYYYACGTNYCTGTNYTYCCNVVGNRYCSGYNTSNCRSWYYSKFTGKTCSGGYNGSNCASYNGGNCNENPPYCVSGYNSYACGTNYCVGYSVAGYYSYSCNCVTCYPQYVRLIQSVANTVTTITSNFISNSVIIKSIKAIVRGNTITAKIYQNTDLTGQIGSDLVFEPTGVALTPRYGIMVKPSSYNQGSTSGEIEIENK